MCERALGAEHPETLIVRAGFARWTGEAGDTTAARDQYAALVPVCEKVLGAGHPQARAARAGLAEWIDQAEKIDQAN